MVCGLEARGANFYTLRTMECRPGANGCSVNKPKIHSRFRNWQDKRRSADDADLRTRTGGDAEAGGGCVGQDWVGRGRRYGHRQPTDNGFLRGLWGNPCGFKSRLRHHRNTKREFGFASSSLFS